MDLITSRQNPIVKHLLLLQKDPHYRLEQKLVFVEGKTLCKELASSHQIKRLFLKEGVVSDLNCPQVHLKPSVFEKLTTLKNSEGYIAEALYPNHSIPKNSRLILALQSIQNPGNAGTLLRSALGFGFEGVLFLGQGVDPYHPKVLRSSMGASLKLPHQRLQEHELKTWLIDHKATLWVADAAGQNVSKTEKPKCLVLLMGNESNGPVIESGIPFEKVALPIQTIDSLNVSIAGSILMYLLGGSHEN